jgi:GTPase SAR1 family protein
MSSHHVSGVDLRKYLQVLSLPQEFSNSSNEEILAYLKELKSSSSEICRMRVMIVGPGDAGKTTLVHRLLTDEFSARQFSMTDGVSMKEWQPSPEMKISLWDFGGQQVYLNTHAMLFSDKTLYLLLWNPRAGTDPRVLEEYLLNVRSRSKTCPIMLVTTHGSEVDKQEAERWLAQLSKHNYVSHHNIDSCTGLGIAELKQSIVKFVSEDCAEHSRVLVPGWYAALESKLKKLSLSKFSIERAEFKSLCSSLWRSSRETQDQGKQGYAEPNSLGQELMQAMKTVLSLFHHWGVVFLLKKKTSPRVSNDDLGEQDNLDNEIGNGDGNGNGNEDQECGDIVLNPQSLADVFKCVITCHTDSTSAVEKRELFEQGILDHSRIESIWSGYEARLCLQFLILLQESELCYEIYDSTGASTNRSLVPSLLPVSAVTNGLNEMTLRDHLLDLSSPFSSSSSAPMSSSPNMNLSTVSKTKKRMTMISQGFVKISFDCLLPNFFPKLMVRLRHLSSPSPTHLSRHHFVVHLPEWDAEEKVARSSWVCVVQDLETKSLLLYPGGCSLGATGICNSVIRELLKESFSGMAVSDLLFTADGDSFLKQKIIDRSRESNSVTLDNGKKILLTFLSPLLGELGRFFASGSDGAGDNDDGNTPADNEDSSLYSTLQVDRKQYENSKDVLRKFVFGNSLIRSIPLYRRPLGLPRSPSILWLVGRSPASEYHLYAVSPSVSPSLPWEIVLDSKIALTASTSIDISLLVDPPARFLIQCLRSFILDDSWPTDISEWGLTFPDGLGQGQERREILQELRRKEQTLFCTDLDMFGTAVNYCRDLLTRQRGQCSNSDLKEVLANQRLMMTQLDRVEGSLSQLTQQLSGALVEIREELLLQAKMSSNEEALTELKEMWRSGMDNLERAIRSYSQKAEKMITEAMTGLELDLDAKLTDLDCNNAERFVSELSKVREELIAANRGRMEGDEASAQKLDQLLSEMRGLQSQLDRVEEKMTQFFGNLTQSLSCVQQELQAKGNSEGLKELRELWVGRIGELETLIRSQSQSGDGNVTSGAAASDADLEKLIKKLDKNLKARFHHFKMAALSNITPQLTEIKQQLLGVAAGVREGDEQSQKRMDSMLLELKGLQTQFVEVIRLQNELSLNLNEVCALLLTSLLSLFPSASPLLSP